MTDVTFDDLDYLPPAGECVPRTSGDHARIDPAAQISLGAGRSQATVARYTCPDCRGSGKWYPSSPYSTYVGKCRRCRGFGMLKTDPAALDRARKAEADRQGARMAAYAAEHKA